MSLAVQFILLFIAALAAGALNALAGGGSFIALPALLFYGVPATTANATSASAMLPGYVSSLVGFRHDVEAPQGLSLMALVAVAAAGGATGAGLLLLSGDRAFAAVVPWLMLFATALFALKPWIQRATRNATAPAWLAALALYLICTYGGYFNGGSGIVIIALLGLLGQTRLIAAVATKSLFSVVMASISVGTYALFGLIEWPLAAVMAVGALAGGWLGARLSYRIPARVHHVGIVLIGLVMTALMFWR